MATVYESCNTNYYHKMAENSTECESVRSTTQCYVIHQDVVKMVILCRVL